jgi:hypothetical protein
MADKTPEELAAEAAADQAERERLAREANKNRNDARVARLNSIADNADQLKADDDELVDLTDEVWDQQDRPENRRKTRAELIAEQEAEEEGGEQTEEEAAAALIRQHEADDRAADEARNAGADDVRKNAAGVTEYQIGGKWLTLKAILELGGETDTSGHNGEDGATTTRTQAPDPAAVAQARRQADETARAEAAAYKARLKDLYTKASMGDEEAIEQLAEIQAGLSRVTPDVLRIVDERVDQRVMGRTAFNAAVEWFETEYAQELATPALKAQAARRDADFARENPDMDPRTRLAKVGQELRQLRIDLGGKPKGAPAQTKQQRKAAVPSVPSAAGRQRPEAEPDEVQSASDAIAAMAKSRGQARPFKH